MTADHRIARATGQPDAGLFQSDGLLGRSVMKWGTDGELSPLDLQQILARLSVADAQAAGMMTCPVDPA
jgi:hypothetical protein